MISFQEAEFISSLNELEKPELDGYDFFAKCMGVEIYRKYIEASKLYEYKVKGEIDCDAETCHKVYMDLNYRKKWDSYVKELYEEEGDENYIYWNVNFPFPLANRDYTYIRESRCFSDHCNGKPTWVILSCSKNVESCVEKSGIIRVKDYKQNLTIQEKEIGKTHVFMHYYDNPGGSIPTWLINWAAKNGIPKFLSDLKKSCDGYEKYLQKTNK